MKVFRRLRSGKRPSKASREAKLLLSDPAMVPSENSSVSSWGNESSLSGSTNQLYLVTEHNEETSNDGTATESSSLPTHLEDFRGDDSPSHYWTSAGNRSSSREKSTDIIFHEQAASPPPFPDSMNLWLNAAHALIQSKEMHALADSSRDLIISTAMKTRQTALSAGGMAVDAALLPVTIPLHVACTATGLVAGVAGSLVHNIKGEGQPSGEKSHRSGSPVDTFIHNVFNFLPFVVNTAGKITNGVWGIDSERQHPSERTSPRSTPRKDYTTSSGESSAERQDVLDRLRLDFQLPSGRKESSDAAFTRATPSDASKFLLRVDDLVVMVSPDPSSKQTRPRKALYVDLGWEFGYESITSDALAQLIQRGLDVTATNGSAHMGLVNHQNSSSIRIDWKSEGSTARIARKLMQVDRAECYRRLNNNVLVWSGKYHGPKYFGSENPLFLARGVVRRSPREFFDMLWDSDRTGEYNNFSLGRSDVHVIDDSISSTGDSGAKVIKSETKVPFAGITVTLSVLMHGKKLKEGSEEGYVIVSRSLSSGMAGCHVGSSKRVQKNNKNEILLGVNVMRSVPGHPELTDLMSVSQVSSSMVPQFLAFRIGMMGVEDFFNNVRKE